MFARAGIAILLLAASAPLEAQRAIRDPDARTTFSGVVVDKLSRASSRMVSRGTKRLGSRLALAVS
jgi:hypothetical protein